MSPDVNKNKGVAETVLKLFVEFQEERISLLEIIVLPGNFTAKST